MPEHRDREQLRTTFDRVSEPYDAARPTYPLARIPPGGEDYDAFVPQPDNGPPGPPADAGAHLGMPNVARKS